MTWRQRYRLRAWWFHSLVPWIRARLAFMVKGG